MNISMGKKYQGYNNSSNNNSHKRRNRWNNHQNLRRNNNQCSNIRSNEYSRLNKEENKQINEMEYNFGGNQINNSLRDISEEEFISKRNYDILKKENEDIKNELEIKKSKHETEIIKLTKEYNEKIKLKENQFKKEIEQKENENEKLKYEMDYKEKTLENSINNLKNQINEKDYEIETLKKNNEKLNNELNNLKNEYNICSGEKEKLQEINLQLTKAKFELMNSLEEEKNNNIICCNSIKNTKEEVLFYRKKFKLIKDVLSDIENTIEENKKYMTIETKEEDKGEELIYNSNYGKVGIDNEEFNCYMSSVIQILKNLKDFSNLILKNNKNNDKIFVSFKNLIKSLYYSQEKSVSLVEFKTEFSKVYKKFEGSKGNDSTFFLIYLLQYLQKIFLTPKRPVTDISEFSFLDLKFEEKQELIKFLETYEPKNYSAIHDIFYGYQMSEIICSGCNKKDISFQSFNILHLSLYDEITKLTSLEQCINSFLFTKDKKGSENFNCSNCRRKCLSHVISIVKLPPILIINLKRVGEKSIYNHDISIPFTLKTNTIEKLEKFDMEYELIGFIKHFGNEKSGHNVAYTRNIFDNKWYCYNDPEVLEINWTNSTDGSFMLFYQLKK